MVMGEIVKHDVSHSSNDVMGGEGLYHVVNTICFFQDGQYNSCIHVRLYSIGILCREAYSQRISKLNRPR